MNPHPPIDQERSWVVASDEGAVPRALDAELRRVMGLSWGAARDLVRSGKVEVDGVRVDEFTHRVSPGEKVTVRPRAPRVHEGGLDRDRIVHVDAHVVVVRKPAGWSTIPYEPKERGTLEERTRQYLVRHERHPAHASLGVVHRIDKETSGLVVFARTFLAKKKLSFAFRIHAIDRRYVALVHGMIGSPRVIRSNLVDDRGDGLRGSGAQGRPSVTHVHPIATLAAPSGAGGDGASVVACSLETGRTHQVRIHLSQVGHPLIGDRVYTRDRLRAGRPLIDAPRLMLHAMVLGFEHPVTGQFLSFVDPLPEDVVAVAARLQGKPFSLDAEELDRRAPALPRPKAPAEPSRSLTEPPSRPTSPGHASRFPSGPRRSRRSS